MFLVFASHYFHTEGGITDLVGIVTTEDQAQELIHDLYASDGDDDITYTYYDARSGNGKFMVYNDSLGDDGVFEEDDVTDNLVKWPT